MKPLRIDSVTGCFTHGILVDLCKGEARYSINIDGYRVSGVSQVCPPVERFKSVFDCMAGIPDKAFCVKSIRREFDKTFLEELVRNRGDVFVVDNGIDFTKSFRLMPNGSILNIDALWNVNNDAACENARLKINEISTDDDPLTLDDRAELYMDFARRIVSMYGAEKVVAVVQKCAVKFKTKDGEVLDFSNRNYTADLKRRFDWMNGVLRTAYGGCRFIEMPDPVYAGDDPRGGCFQLHPNRDIYEFTKSTLVSEFDRISAEITAGK